MAQVINAFASQTDVEMKGKVVQRLYNITHLQKVLIRCMKGTISVLGLSMETKVSVYFTLCLFIINRDCMDSHHKYRFMNTNHKFFLKLVEQLFVCFIVLEHPRYNAQLLGLGVDDQQSNASHSNTKNKAPVTKAKGSRKRLFLFVFF